MYSSKIKILPGICFTYFNQNVKLKGKRPEA